MIKRDTGTKERGRAEKGETEMNGYGQRYRKRCEERIRKRVRRRERDKEIERLRK